MKGFDLEKSVTVGNWVASKAVQEMGISGLPMIDDLEDFLEEYDKENDGD